MPFKDPKVEKEHASKRSKKHYLKNKERIKAQNYGYKLRRHYGLTIEDVQELKVKQENRCLGCGFTKPLCVDHDHETGEIRGLLCRQCNACIGLAKENVQVLKNLVSYLET